MADLIASSKLTAVVGLGISGLATARFLARQGERFILLDTRAEPPLLPQFLAEFPEQKPVCGPLNIETLTAVDQIILSPGVAKTEPAIAAAEQAGVAVLGDVDLFVRHAQAPIIAITGSNGKTTVTTLVGGMAAAAGLNIAVGGNIGTPVLDLLAEPTPDFYVLELSSFQLETTHNLAALAAVVLNLSRDHMDRYPSYSAYHAAKMRIFFGVQTMLVNRDDPLTRGPLAAGVKQVSFGLSAPDLKQFGILQVGQEAYLAKGTEPLLAVSRLQLRGSHNHSNALAAMALVDEMGVLNSAALQFLAAFPGVAHRCQWVAEKNGVVFINDSKATNVGATLAALKGLSSDLQGTANSQGRIHVILGGQGKGADFTELLGGLGERVATALVLGEDAEKIIAAIKPAVPVVAVATMQEAVEQAYALAAAGDLVLLSPACASFDMFNGYEHRGQVFESAVEALAA
ncbi:UDP-N-acetylmuramoyl-L-alanine--D-glutamate ligase [Halioxenophilus sp. WMMB6]|uniref:UDP-N-acetylmuramoyl-L-alanine--D-glutamate ligase n=1 Tax=Halioxenophilus sp. WMMB6 TaxID=3073815 RepID=UPI00295EA2A4|nr:UDP-N-acetylmuramoyl-L-alanine--D-glutamate ligase [Halioxenophilus sp. WMMB6]